MGANYILYNKEHHEIIESHPVGPVIQYTIRQSTSYVDTTR